MYNMVVCLEWLTIYILVVALENEEGINCGNTYNARNRQESTLIADIVM